MSLGIGIDTGGTYTDAVIYDFKQGKVLGKGKALTTREDLSVGIANALDCLPIELAKQARLLALSTTLATNACVEGKGGRAKLILLGLPEKVLSWVDAKSAYGLDSQAVMCLNDTQPHWEELIHENRQWLEDARALSVAAVGALQDGAACEKTAAAELSKEFGLPVVMANQVAYELNAVERGATALLNARLLPVIGEFMGAVKAAINARSIEPPTMVVRSDGSLMSDKLSRRKPVETILSGPAASVLGGRGLTDCKDCLIVDIGGTTTDISIVEKGLPVMTGGIRIGGWRTQVKGVYIDTFGLGGDSRVVLNEGKPELSTRRVEPMCVALKRWPQLKKTLSNMLDRETGHRWQLYEVLYLVRQPKELTGYSSRELELIERLKQGPCMLGSGGLDLYNLKSERLEDEGVVMRCGLTPTDIMHILGEFNMHDTQAAVLCAKYMLKAMGTEESLEQLCQRIYDLVCKKLYENIVRIMLLRKFPELMEKGEEYKFSALVEKAWETRNEKKGILGLNFTSDFSLVGIGAPTHIFLPKVAQVLGTDCKIPEHAEVANAVGAIIADIRALEKVEVSPVSDGACITAYRVYTRQGAQCFEKKEEAVEAAKKAARAAACDEARSRGAIGELYVEDEVEHRTAYSKEGVSVELSSIVSAVARSVPEYY